MDSLFFRYCRDKRRREKEKEEFRVRNKRRPCLPCFSSVVPANGKTSGIPLVDGKIVDS